MLSDTNAIHPATSPAPTFKLVKVCNSTGLYRLALPGGKPEKPTGAYYALVKRGGKQFRRSLKTQDRKLADRRLNDLRGRVGNLTTSDDARPGFDQVAERWLAVDAHTRKPRSVERRRCSLMGLAPLFRDRALRNITKTHCERWLTERGPRRSAQSFARELGTMKSVFDYAVESGLPLGNPASHIKRRRIPQAQIAVPSREQFQQIIAAIRTSDGRADSQRKAAPGADLLVLLAFFGMHLGEGTALRWADVNFDAGTLSGTGGDDVTKNHESRTIPMTDALRSLLCRLHEERQPAPQDNVSTTGDAGTAFGKACKRLGVPHFTHHDLRHFFAATCIEAGVDIPTISRWLGHKDGGALAMKVYDHLRQEHSAAQIKRVQFSTATPAPNNVPLPNLAANVAAPTAAGAAQRRTPGPRPAANPRQPQPNCREACPTTPIPSRTPARKMPPCTGNCSVATPPFVPSPHAGSPTLNSAANTPPRRTTTM